MNWIKIPTILTKLLGFTGETALKTLQIDFKSALSEEAHLLHVVKMYTFLF